jgi:aspartate aminotransferase-like enzyme
LDREDPHVVELFTPGPVDSPPYIMEALNRPVVHHRSPGFKAVYRDLAAKMKALLETTAPILVLASSGTGAMDAVVSNLFAEGDEVLVPVMGKFSARWVEICGTYGVRPHVIESQPGGSPEPGEIHAALSALPGAKGVLLTHCETSTGSLADLEAVSKSIADLETGGRVILKCADCVSSFCVDELRMEPWGLDAVITASQKGMVSPVGLSFVCLGERARERAGMLPPRNYYLDLRRYLESSEQEWTPFTPAVSIVYAAAQALGRILDIGLEEVWAWYRRAAGAVTLAVEAAGFDALARRQSGAVVAFRVGGLDAEALALRLEREHGIYLARGQGALRGRILRVSPLGKTRRKLAHFSDSLLRAVRGMPGAPEITDSTISDVHAKIENLLKGRDIWE